MNPLIKPGAPNKFWMTINKILNGERFLEFFE
jgi:hypothetical protein